MEISIFQAILLGLLYYLTNNGTPWVTGLGSVSIRQPIVCGTITGLILGDPIRGHRRHRGPRPRHLLGLHG